MKSTITDAISHARRGSKIVVIANFKERVDIEIVLIQRKELTMYGILMYVREDFEEAARLIAEEKINTKALITNYFDIKQFLEAYQYIDNNQDTVLKVLVKIGD